MESRNVKRSENEQGYNTSFILAVSFLFPYFILLVTDTWYGSFQDKLNAGPCYIVGSLFLFITLLLLFDGIFQLFFMDSAICQIHVY